MTEILNQNTISKSPEKHEKPSEWNTFEKFRNTLTNIEEEFVKHSNSNEAEILMKKQSREINNILISKYPDFFWKIQKATWYDQWNVYSGQISTLLDIIQYGTPNQKEFFIEMMNAAENNKSEKVLELYERYFIGTRIGNNISVLFHDSKLKSYLNQKVLNTFDMYAKSWKLKNSVIYDNINSHPEWKNIAQAFLRNIPKSDLDTLLSLLPEIENLCTQGNKESLKQKIDALSIDVIYKESFFDALTKIRSLWHEENRKKDMEFYFWIDQFYFDKINVWAEKEKLKENKTKWLHFLVLETSFPNIEKTALQEKNDKLNYLIEKCVKEDGKIAIDSKEFKKQLLEIFKGSEIGTRLENKNLSGKEALKIVAEAAKEKKKHTEEVLKNHSPSFDVKKIFALQNKYPERYKEFIEILFSNKKSDEKIKVLRKLDITPEQFKSEEEKENYIKSIQWYLQADATERNFQSILQDDKKLDAFNSYYAWKINTEDFNKAIEKRDQEIQQAEIKQKTSSKQSGRTNERAYEFSQIDFSKTPFHEVIPTKIGDISFGIRKDTKDSSTILYKWMEISGVKTENLGQAPEMVQFIGNTGLDVFGTHISDILAIINNKQTKKGGKEQIDLKNGLWSNEKYIILKSLADILISETDASNKEGLEENFKNIQRSGGMLKYLRQNNKEEYIATDNSININAVKKSLERTV